MKRIILIMMVTAGFTILHAQEISAEDKAKAEKEIKAEVENRTRDIVTLLVIAEKLKMDFPPSAPSESVENLNAQVDKVVTEQVNKEFPLNTRDKHLKVAVQKYRLYKVGDMLKDFRLSKAGRKAVVSGEFRGYTRTGQLKIGSYEVPKVDMRPEVMQHFDPALNKKKIETYIKNKMFYFEEDRQKKRAELTPKVKKEFFTKAGYYQSGKEYFPAVEYLKKVYEEEKARVAEKLYKEVKEQVLAKYNLDENALVAKKEDDKSKDKVKNEEDPFDEPKETVKTEPKKEETGSGVRKRVPLFDPSFYDPDF